MNYLIDTHTFLWFISDDAKLSAAARGLIEDSSNTIFLSVATLPFNHRDPFDGLIIAQAITDNLSVIGNASTFDACGIQRHW